MPGSRKPLVGIPCCTTQQGLHPFHQVGDKYIMGVVDGADAVPLLIPALGDRLASDQLLDSLDGLLITGSPSNVEPRHFNGPPSDPGTEHDPRRDATNLPLIRAAVARGLPVLAICRGFQEMNVVFGGSLHQKLHEVGGYQEHREDKALSVDLQYGPAHSVSLEPGGWLASWTGLQTAMVNSLHTQGVDRLGDGLIVEARADDGLVEAFRVADAPAFALAVQWHPEWKVRENPFYQAIFTAFGDACRQRALTRVS